MYYTRCFRVLIEFDYSSATVAMNPTGGTERPSLFQEIITTGPSFIAEHILSAYMNLSIPCMCVCM